MWNGIANKIDWLKGKVKGVVDKIKGWFTNKDGFDEHSPSKWSEKVGKFLMQGLANGITADMSAEEIAENVDLILKRVESHLEKGRHNIASAYVKTTMGPSERVL